MLKKPYGCETCWDCSSLLYLFTLPPSHLSILWKLPSPIFTLTLLSIFSTLFVFLVKIFPLFFPYSYVLFLTLFDLEFLFFCLQLNQGSFTAAVIPCHKFYPFIRLRATTGLKYDTILFFLSIRQSIFKKGQARTESLYRVQLICHLLFYHMSQCFVCVAASLQKGEKTNFLPPV